MRRYVVRAALASLSAVTFAPALTAQQPARLVVEVRVAGDNSPLSDALAVLSGPAAARGRTGVAGRITFSGLAPGAYRVAIHSVGFRPAEAELAVASGRTVRAVVTLTPANAPVELDPVTVAATRTATPRHRTPASVSVVSGDALEALQASSLDDVLGALPNVTTVGGPRGIAELPQIRGLGSDRIAIRVDGARQNFQSGHKGRLFLDPALLKRVEVVRGGTSALDGTGGVGGTIAFETKDADHLLAPSERFAVEIAPRGRTSGEELGGLFTAAGRGGPVDGFVAFSVRDAGDIRLGDGTDLPFSGGEFRSWLASLGVAPAAGHRIEASYRRLDEDSRTPLNANGATTDSAGLGERDTANESLRLAYRLATPSVPWLDARAVTYRDESRVTERRLSDGRLEARTVTTWGFDASATGRAAVTPALGVALTTGAEYFADDNHGVQNGTALASFPDGSAHFLGVFAQARIDVTRFVSVLPGLRFDTYTSRSDDPTAPENDADDLQARIAGQFHPTELLTLYGSYAQGFTAPRVQDLYISGLHFPATPGAPFPNNFFVPNPDLVPERADTYEAGLRFRVAGLADRADGLEAELTYFDVGATDFISRDVDVFGGTTTLRNIDEVDLDGIEARVAYDAPVAFAAVSYGRTRAQNLTADTPVDDAPADSWVLEGGTKLLQRALVVGWRTTIAAAQERVTEPELATPGYTVHDAFARWRAPRGPLGALAVSLRLNNVLDKAYRRHGSAILEAGRDVRLGVSYRIGVAR